MPANSETSPVIHSLTEGGITATHLTLPEPTARVAPALAPAEHNTIKSSLVPFACWRANDMRFAFDSSFPLPEIAAEFAALHELIQRHILPDADGAPKFRPALSVFGHADPVGSDDYNKSLSGRRSQAVYGLLVRKVDLWEDLYSHPLGNDRWDPTAIEAMQAALGQPPSGPLSAAERQKLYKAYMDQICVFTDAQRQTQPYALAPSDFLARGADSRGKGDYQGCSEFNPVLIFSEKENQEFSDPKRKEKRDAENAPNRRVLIFLFRPGVNVRPEDWPCPRAKEGVEGCKKRFWSDGDKRRNRRLPDERRKVQETHDTFACRFYDRLTTHSPCDRPSQRLGYLVVRLFFHARPMAGMFVEFLQVTPEGELGDAVGDPVLTDEEGKAMLRGAVPLGRYAARVEYQPPQVICTVSDPKDPEILVLPIGRPYWAIEGGDIDFEPNKS